MNNQPNIKYCELSIIIVSYNTNRMTQECLQSIYSNTGNLSVEVIVVDNHSQDGTLDMIITLFPQVHLIINQENRGFAAANNQGFAVARGKYILLLNTDTIILGDVLINSVRYLVDHCKVGAMGCQVLNSDHTVQATCSGYPTLSRLLFMTLALDRLPVFSFLDTYLFRAWQRDNACEVEVISGCYLMVRREVLDTVGGLDERFFFFAEETDWCHRMKKAGWRLMFEPVGRIIHHGGGSINKLNHNRDVMLTAATVRLHQKHDGTLSAIAVYLTLMTFNLSRAIIWKILALLNNSEQQRANHFMNVVRSYRKCWPN